MNDIYLNRLKNNGLHPYGMQVINSVSFLPREAFLTECKQHLVEMHLSVKENAQFQPCIPLGMQPNFLNYEREHTIH